MQARIQTIVCVFFSLFKLVSLEKSSIKNNKSRIFGSILLKIALLVVIVVVIKTNIHIFSLFVHIMNFTMP